MPLVELLVRDMELGRDVVLACGVGVVVVMVVVVVVVEALALVAQWVQPYQH